MDFRQLAARRKLAGVCATALLCLVIALLADGMIAGGRKDPNLHELLPGQTLKLTDPMPRGTEKLEDLSLRASSPEISVRLVEMFSGFWLGGTLWRAEVTLPADLALGNYTLAMHYAHNGTEAAPRQAYQLRVHKDAAGIQAASLSPTMRYLGVSPYLLALCLLPLLVLPMLASLLLSRRIGQALAAEGMAEIFRAMASPEGQRIFFTQAQGRSLAPESSVTVLDETGRRILGTARVVAVTRGDVEAVMLDGACVRPGVLAQPQAGDPPL